MPNTLEETVVEVITNFLKRRYDLTRFEDPKMEARLILAALDKDGLVVVPREPTEDMKRVARHYFGMNPFQQDGAPMDRLWLRCWAAMLTTRQISPIAAPAVRSEAKSAPGITHPQAPYTPEPRKEEL